jgi:hypothetical protein
MSTGSAPQSPYPPQANQPPTYASAPPAGQWGGQPTWSAPRPSSGWGARGPKVKSYWTVFVFALIAMILAAVALGASWQYGSETEDGITITENYYITQTVCGSSSAAGGGTSCTTLTSNVPGGYYAAEALIIVGLVLAILLVVFSILGALGLALKGLQARLMFLFGILAIPITLAAPFAFLGSSYNNSDNAPGLFVSPWTAGAGWYCAIVAGVILIIFFLLARKSIAEQQRAIAAGGMYAAAPSPAPAYGSPPAAAPAYGSPPAASPAYGYAAPAAAAPAPAAAPAGPPICPKCGRPTTYIAEYQRYYCYTDQQYV